MSLDYNRERLVKQSVTGEITHPMQGRSPYIVSAEGEPEVLPGVGGICFNVRVGDSAIDWEVDHVEPGASFSHLENKADRQKQSNYAFNVQSCVGNEAVLISGEAEGETGVVVGKHGGIEHVMIDFDPDVLDELRVGDKVQVRSWGVGLKLDGPDDVKAINVGPELLDGMDLTVEDDRLRVPVTHEIPARVMGSGLGADNVHHGDYDIQMFDDSTVEEFDLESLRLGDVVAIRDADHTYGRIYREGAVSIGTVVHSRSIISGHGPGVSTLFTSANGSIEPVKDEDSNLNRWLDLPE